MRIVLFVLALCCLPACLLAADKELIGDPKAFPGINKPKIDDAAIDKAGFRIGVQAYTFREMSLYETLDTMKYLGIHYVELYGGQALSKENPKIKVGHDMPAQYIDELLAKLKEANVMAVSYGVTQVGDTEASLVHARIPATGSARVWFRWIASSSSTAESSSCT